MPSLVLDAGSRDRTVAFAKASGARVIQRPWTDFVDARRFALAAVETPWVLMLDADEALDDVLRDAIAAAPEDTDAYAVRRTTFFCGRPLRVWRNERLIRVFRRDRVQLEAQPAAGSTARIHERWTCEGIVGELAGTLLHYSYPDVAAYRTKYDRYTSLEATALEPSVAAVARRFGASLLRFPWLLVGRGAILDGPRGWYVAYHSAVYPAVAALKSLRGQRTGR